jgi:hypothetical protein
MISIFVLTFIAIASIFVDFSPSKHSNKIELNRAIRSDVINRFQDDKLLLYFGHIDLEQSLKILDFLGNIHKSIFINLSEKKSKIDNKNIQELKLEDSELQEIAREFQVYFDKPILRDTKEEHLPLIYLIKRYKDGFKIRYIYKSLAKDEILKDLDSL